MSIEPNYLDQVENWACLLQVGDELCWFETPLVLDRVQTGEDEIQVSGLMDERRVTIDLDPDDMVTYRRPQ